MNKLLTTIGFSLFAVELISIAFYILSNIFPMEKVLIFGMLAFFNLILFIITVMGLTQD